MFYIQKRNGDYLEKPYPREIASYATRQDADKVSRLVPGSKVVKA